MCVTPCISACPLWPNWLFVAPGRAPRASDSVCAQQGTVFRHWELWLGDLWFHNELLCVVELWSSSLGGQRSIVCSSAQQRRPDWTGLGSTTGQTSSGYFCLSVCHPLSYIFVYPRFLFQAVVAVISHISIGKPWLMSLLKKILIPPIHPLRPLLRVLSLTICYQMKTLLL